MKYKILFPSEMDNIKAVDPSFNDEFEACVMLGIETCLYDYDLLISDGKFKSTLTKYDGYIIYRGWMLKPTQYSTLCENIKKVTVDAIMLNNPTQYTNCHCFPNVYDIIKKHTPRIVLVDDPKSILNVQSCVKKLNSNFIIKDHVKSTKIGNDIHYYDKNIRTERLIEIFDDFITERGNLYTNGIVIKQYVDLHKKDKITNEWRAFYMFGKLVMLNLNSERDIKDCVRPSPELIEKLGEILKTKSNFFTVDFALTDDGNWTVIETGDGQVSGMAYYSKAIVFYAQLYNFIADIK